jgi:hypothetical protein
VIRVGFIINFEKDQWVGGYNHFVNLFNFIKQSKTKNIEPVLITDNLKRIKKENSFKGFEIISTNLVSNTNKYIRLVNKILIIIFGKNFLFDRFLKKNKITILSHSGFTGIQSKIKSYPWLPDFQELHFPKNFSLKKKILRKINILLSTKHSTKIIVSSKSVQKDLKKISNKSYKKSVVLNHTNNVVPLNKLKSLKYLKKKYSIERNFYLLPNHYWVHKNHIVVLKALKCIKKPKFQIVSTGMCFDHRKPRHFLNLEGYIKENKLNNSYKILGIVSFLDLCSLMYHSLGIINPSKSEGWGNSADQATLLGNQAILSDIAVHKEQKKKNYIYFRSNDHIELSKILIKGTNYKKKKVVTKLQKNLQHKYIKDFETIILNN